MSDFKETQHGRNHRVILVDGVVVNGGSDFIPGLADILNSTSSGPRIVRGAVYNDATIITGTGFTAEWNDEDLSSPGANLITIRFDEPFEDPGPIVVYGINNNLPADVSGEYQVGTKTRDPDFIVVEGKELDGTENIGGFDFAAIEAAT